MLVFIDESGDAGFKIGSSAHLVIALIIFDDYNEADKTRELIQKTLTETRQKPEFKFSRCSNSTRDAFFEAIRHCYFRIGYICVGKSTIHSSFLPSNPANFYNYTLKLLIQHAALQDARIRIDGNGKKEMNKALKTYLRTHSDTCNVKSLRFVDSRAEELIQLADMVTSAIARPFNNPDKKDTDRWKRIIQHKIDARGEWIFS